MSQRKNGRARAPDRARGLSTDQGLPTHSQAYKGGPAIHGVVVTDVSREKDDFDGTHKVVRAIQSGACAPAGADVVLIVAPGQYRPYEAIEYLIDNGQHLRSITIQCSVASAVEAWVRALRGLPERNPWGAAG